MEKDKRKHPRFNPAGLPANIIIEPHSQKEKIILAGTVIDLSVSGIKIKLDAPVNIDIPESEIQININMPESGIPIAIRGNIKHLTDDLEYGLQYLDNEAEELNKLMFECIKTTIKTTG